MTNRFLISVAAAALIAGTGFANAQGTGMGRDAGPAGSTAQQGAPSSERGAPSAAPMNRDSASDSKGTDKGMKATQSDEKMPQGGKNQRAQDDVKPGAKGEKSAQDNVKGEKSAQDNMKGEKSKSTETTTDKGAPSKDMKAEQKGAADSKSQTTGQAGAGAKLSTEQRTQITTVIKETRVQPVTNVNFSISVGTRVPRDVHFHALPPRVVTIYPEWRSYKYILVKEQIVIIDPDTFEIVAVLES
ncbi:DUF1236 domain-containing protein [Bradyrhizobium sp. SRL28]|uniref:DUF1236 domain-containing protein n=1 Tax=Bradyrhizobium sp. SRL28 TaxID=2836178 RepID=UPI001BDE4B2A|nr:DUF1236 domain-containing protein [Bradyrhizobium sp. SRL28]MBT1514402.1 DUF1236 domain-containing protein [Bradyrhizobium sp. SRL28]